MCGRGSRARIDDVMLALLIRCALLVVARRAHRHVRPAKRFKPPGPTTRMTDPDRPRLIVRVVAGEIEVAARVDREVRERATLELPRCHIDRESFRDRPEVEKEWTCEHDSSLIDVQRDVAIGGVAVALERCPNDCAAPMLTIEAACLELEPDRRIERPTTLLGDSDREADGLEQQVAHGNALADACGQLAELT